MSPTYAHCQGSSSLPSDYAVLSGLNIRHNDSESDSDSLSDTDTIHPAIGPKRLVRRKSFPHYRRPTSTIGLCREPYGQVSSSVISERTPLLSNPPDPGIEEQVDNDDCRAEEDLTFLVFWEEFLILAKYSLPVFGTYILEYSLVIVSVVSIGHISTTALAAISLGSMTASVSGFSIIHGMTSALDTLLPSAWTSQPQLVGLWAQRMTVVMFACLIPTLVIWLNAESILLFLRQEPEVAHLAATYLRWVSLGLPAYAFNCISWCYFQSQGLFTIPTRIVLIVAPTNVLLNYLLVWGPEPIRLGFIGAPIATAISFNLISLLCIIHGIFFIPRTAWCPISRRSFTGFDVLLRLGLSGVGQTASEWWAWELVALAASFLGPVALATQSVLLVTSSTMFQGPFALGVATAVRIGNLLGEQNAHRARLAANTSFVLGLSISCISSAILFAFRSSWAYLFNNDPKVVSLVASILPLVSLFQVFDATTAVTGGILRAQGKQMLGAVLSLSGYYIFGIPLGIFFAFKRQFGLHGLWWGLTLSLIYCSVLGTWLCMRTDWEREVQKVQDRLREEDKIRKIVTEV